MHDDIFKAIVSLDANKISHELQWTLDVIKNEIIDQFTWLELDQVVENGLIKEYVRWVADGEETFVCKECQEKVHVVMECNHFGALCNGCCPHTDCSEIDKEFLSEWNKRD